MASGTGKKARLSKQEPPQSDNKQARKHSAASPLKHRKVGLRKYNKWAAGMPAGLNPDATLNFTKPKELLRILNYDIKWIGMCIDNWAVNQEFNRQQIQGKLETIEKHIRTCVLERNFKMECEDLIINKIIPLHWFFKKNDRINDTIRKAYQELVDNLKKLEARNGTI